MKILTILLLLFVCQSLIAQGFQTTSSQWITPNGGYTNTSGVNLGYYQLSNATTNSVNNNTYWFTFDINGDLIPDLIETAKYSSSLTFTQQFGVGTGTQFWKVYIGGTNGFQTTPINWTTPNGGYTNTSGVNLGFYTTSNSSSGSVNNNTYWELLDMNGDGKLDLVETAKYSSSLTFIQQFGVGTGTQFWKVYYNTGTGFQTTATNWNTPIGGYTNTSGVNLGFYSTTNSTTNSVNNNTHWSLMDIDGDGKPDLVETAIYKSSLTFTQQFGVGTGTQYWKVYYNTGTGFQTTATNWTTPNGGYTNTSGVNLGFYTTTNSTTNSVNNNTHWSLIDIDGDGKPDLIETAIYTSSLTFTQQFGVGTGTQYWKVYYNTGTGFQTTATNWTTPNGGYTNTSGVNLGFYTTTNSTTNSVNNNTHWSLMDIDGDGKPDLIETAIYTSSLTFTQQFGVGTGTQYWKVYYNTGTGFQSSASNWTTPNGGYTNTSGVNLGFYTMFNSSTNSVNNNTYWSLIDINGDTKLDLVETAIYKSSLTFTQQFGVGTGTQFWRVYLNTSTTTSLSNEIEQAGLNIYPNPFQDKIYFNKDWIGKNYQITSIEGKILISGKIENDNLILESLSSGMYVLTVENVSLKIIKN